MCLSSRGAVALTDADVGARLNCGAIDAVELNNGFATVTDVKGARLGVNGVVDAATDSQTR